MVITSGIPWSDHDNASPIKDLQSVLRNYRDRSVTLTMQQDAWDHLVRCFETHFCFNVADSNVSEFEERIRPEDVVKLLPDMDMEFVVMPNVEVDGEPMACIMIASSIAGQNGQVDVMKVLD